MRDRAVAEVNRILNTHQPEPMDAALVREIDRIVESARREWKRHHHRHRAGLRRGVTIVVVGGIWWCRFINGWRRF